MLKTIQTIILLFFAFKISISNAQKSPQVVLEEVSRKCRNLAHEDKVILQVARFSSSTNSASGRFGGELATMLTNALQETSCFRVIGLDRDVSDNTQSMRRMQMGFGAEANVAGKAIRPQLIVTGEITEFSEGKKGTNLGVVSLGSNNATVGFVFQVKDPVTFEILFSKSINMSGTSSGFTGVKLLGVNAVGTIENKALSDACEKAIIRAVEVLVDEKDRIPIPEKIEVKSLKKFTPENCDLIKSGQKPTVMIFIPEVLTAGNSSVASNARLDQMSREERAYEERRENREIIKGLFGLNNTNSTSSTNTTNTNKGNALYTKKVVQESTTENELIKMFLDAGYKVIDPKIYKNLIGEEIMSDDPAELAAAGFKMGANVIVSGFATTERQGIESGMNTFRGRIEARVLNTSDASLIASHESTAGGIDISETAASKQALVNASADMASHILEKLCASGISFQKLSTASAVTTVTIQGVTFMQLTAIYNHLKKQNKVVDVKRTLADGAGEITIMHDVNTDKIAEYLMSPTLGIEITGLDENSITASSKQ